MPNTTVESAWTPLEILKRREVLLQEYRQNCLFRFQNHLFDSTSIPPTNSGIHLDVFHVPVMVQDERGFLEEAKKTFSIARKTYFQEFI